MKKNKISAEEELLNAIKTSVAIYYRRSLSDRIKRRLELKKYFSKTVFSKK